MPDGVERRSALAEVYRAGSFGRELADGPGVELTERRSLSIVEIQAWPETVAALCREVRAALQVDLPRRANGAMLSANGTSAICTGPERWLIVEREWRDLFALIRAAAAGEGRAAVTDQGHGRVGIRLGGRNVRRLLSKGTAIDLRRNAFPPGRGTATRLEHFAVVLHCLDDDLFDLFVLRSYAASLYEWLLDASLEFGCRVNEPV